MPQYITIVQAAKTLPARPHRNTVRRWMDTGCRGIRLRSIRFGGKILTTEQWCEEFVQAVSAGEAGQLIAHHKAEAKLDQLGV